MRFLTVCFMILSSAAAAQSTADTAIAGMRDGDALLTQKELQAQLVGQTLVFFDDGQSYFYNDGRYTYTYGGEGGTAYGYYELGENGRVCIDYVNGFRRCDTYLKSGARMVLLTEAGDRFPIRSAD